ncbi:MAG: ATP-binding protein, partial [Parvularculaceae bacterium]
LGTAHLIAQKVQHGAFDVLCVHGIAGAIGTILVAGFCDPTVLVASSRMMQFSVQTFGTILIGGVSFGSVYGALLLLKKRGAQRDVRPVPVALSTPRPARQTRLSQPIATPSLAPILQTQMAQMTQIMAQHRNISAQLQRSSESLVAMLEELRKYAKTRVETITLAQAPFNLPDLIAQVVHQSKQQARTNVTLKTLYHPSLSQEFIADSGRIRQILNHLLANAIQYTASGSIILKVDGKQTEDDIDLVIGIADTGIGIAPDQLKDLFETADHLSLSICKSLVNSLGGEIGVVSKLGQGSTFWVRMPLRLAPSVALTNISKTAA